MLRVYGNIRLADIEAMKPEFWDFAGATHARVTIPSCADTETIMYRQGFFLADRTLKVVIGLSKAPSDLKRFIRLPIVETADYKDDIFTIAHESFTRDRRFHILPKCDQAVSGLVLRDWVAAIDKAWVCLYHDKPIGFLVLKSTASDTVFVHLAAVKEEHRVTGAAMSLYAKAIEVAKERGYKKVEGRISSLNTAVMNIYAVFGAVFSDPQDIFLKELA